MIARVAEHCFWLGRHVERAESSARLLAVTRSLSLDAGLTPQQCWWPVVVVSGEREVFARRYGTPPEDGELVQRYLAWDEDTPSSIRCTLRDARENARAVRDVVSQEVWEVLNELHLWLGGADAARQWKDDRHGFYRHVLRTCQLTLGVMRETMLHEDAYHFIVLGVMLERAGQTARLLDVHHHAFPDLGSHRVIEAAASLAVLQACSGLEPFMRRNHRPITPEAIGAFLALDPAFPRSIHFALASALDRLERIRRPTEPGQACAESLLRLRALCAWIRDPSTPVEPRSLHASLTEVVNETARICDAIGRELLGMHPSALPQETLQ